MVDRFWMMADGLPGTPGIYYFGPLRDCNCPVLPTPPLPAGVPFRPALFTAGPGEIPGVLLYIEHANIDRARFGLQLRNGNASSAGSMIPVVRDRDLQSGGVTILGLVPGGGFRYMLRVYDTDRHANATVKVQVIGAGGLEIMSTEAALRLDGTTKSAVGIDFPLRPSYAQLDLSALLTHLPAGAAVAIRVTPAAGDLRIWAFASKTNDQTNEVTVFAPQ